VLDNNAPQRHLLLMNEPISPPPADWLREIAESEAQLAAGEIVSGDAVLQELRDDIAQLEAKLSRNRQRSTA
jgi:hypothetical protein